MLQGTAADALRPYTPRRMKHLALEETKRFKKLGFGTKWNLRDLLRHRSRSWMTLFGIVGCMVLLVGGMGMKDTLDSFMDVFFDRAFNYTTKINLDTESVTNGEAVKIAEEYDGDWAAQSSVQIGDRGIGLEVYEITHDKVRFADGDMNVIGLTDDGAYIYQRAGGGGVQPPGGKEPDLLALRNGQALHGQGGGNLQMPDRERDDDPGLCGRGGHPLYDQRGLYRPYGHCGGLPHPEHPEQAVDHGLLRHVHRPDGQDDLAAGDRGGGPGHRGAV